jgi:hypothetical protein
LSDVQEEGSLKEFKRSEFGISRGIESNPANISDSDSDSKSKGLSHNSSYKDDDFGFQPKQNLKHLSGHV